MLVDSEAKPIRGLAFKNEGQANWHIGTLKSVNCTTESRLAFSTPNATYQECAIVTEVADPFNDWYNGTLKISFDIDAIKLLREAYELGQKNPLDTTKKPDESAGS